MNKLINRIKHARRSDWQRAINKLLCHTAIVISGMLIVFFLIDRVNKPMAFILRKGQSPCEFLGGLSGFLSRRCRGLRPCVESGPEPEDSSPVLTWILDRKAHV